MKDATADVPEGWEGILEPGERILWQGRPEGRISFRGLEPRRAIAGLVFLGFAVFWTIGAASAGADGLMGLLFPLFGLPFILIGAQLAGGGRIVAAFVQRRSWYSLSNRRAFVATDIFGRRQLHDWPIGADTVIDFEAGPPDSLLFADAGDARRGRRFGFEQISDGHEVLSLMRRIQRGSA